MAKKSSTAQFSIYKVSYDQLEKEFSLDTNKEKNSKNIIQPMLEIISSNIESKISYEIKKVKYKGFDEHVNKK